MRRAALLLASLIATTALAVEPTPAVVSVATYRGADRTQKLVAGAQREGELMLYSSLTQEDQLRLAADFKKRYGVTLKFWRGSQANILQRVVTETRGGRFDFDVIETNSPQIEAISREQLLQKVTSPLVEQVLLPDILPPSGDWTPDRLNLVVYAFNTKAIERSGLPRAWADFTDARWKGRVGMESTNVEWFEALVEAMGEDKGLDFFRRMGEQGIAVRTGHTHSTGRVIAGEIPVFLGVYSHDVDRMKAKGAPVDWFILPPAIVLPSAVALSRRAPHPNAAVLFYDYMLGEGQKLYTQMYRVPANRNFDTAVRRLLGEGQPIKVVDSRKAIDDYDRWLKLYRKLIVDRSQH